MYMYYIYVCILCVYIYKQMHTNKYKCIQTYTKRLDLEEVFRLLVEILEGEVAMWREDGRLVFGRPLSAVGQLVDLHDDVRRAGKVPRQRDVSRANAHHSHARHLRRHCRQYARM